METVAAALAVLLPLTMSPGPVGFALAAIVMSFGARAAIPFVLGVQSAAILVGIASALGLSQLFIAYPSVQMVLRYAGTAYVAWLGWKFLNAHPKPGGELTGNAPGYFPGMATALLNPKFYIMVIAVFGNFLGRPGVASWLLVFSPGRHRHRIDHMDHRFGIVMHASEVGARVADAIGRFRRDAADRGGVDGGAVKVLGRMARNVCVS